MKIPDPWRGTRVVAISKDGKTVVRPDKVRVLQMADHPLKVLEQTLLFRAMDHGWLDTGPYQKGFKRGE
jgi:hypothetical protein